jgi:L-threonylcarbamoyladenylate synthase
LKTEIGTDLLKAIRLLNSGEIVAIPTETVYGLAGNGLNTGAVTKIYNAKRRPSFNPLILHFPSFQSVVDMLGKNIPPYLESLVKKFSPGPITYVINKGKNVPDITTSGLETVAFRIPNHPLALKLLEALNFPLAAPSANLFGLTSPTTAQHVFDQLHKRVPYILDGGHCSVGVESTILDCTQSQPIIRRFGGTTKEDIELWLGIDIKVEVNGSKILSPGMLDSHYSPGIPIDLYSEDEWDLIEPPMGSGFLSLSKLHPKQQNQPSIQLSLNRDLNEAATRLFESFRILSQSNCKRIIAHRMPEEGLGLAINDRLKRASATQF